MSEAQLTDVQRLLAETARQVFREYVSPHQVAAAAEAGWSPELWGILEETGLTLLGMPEALGGADGSLADLALLTGIAAEFSVPVPLGETLLLASWLLATVGAECPAGPLTATVVRDGRASRVPYARAASAIVVLTVGPDGTASIGLARAGQYSVEPGANMAGEPRDDVTFEGWEDLGPAPAGVTPEAFRSRVALLRAIQLDGAIRRVLELSAEYAQQRRQFGVALSRFQAIQHMLATMAGEAAAASAAVLGAVHDPTPTRIAAAKLRVGEAASQVAPISHQLHGAIGFTQEYQLHHLTRRLWSWRDEAGAETEHATALGQAVAQVGSDGLWTWITGEADLPLG